MYLSNGMNGGLGATLTAGGYAGASVPAAAGASPQGSQTITQQAFGIVAGGGDESSAPGYAILGGGAAALAALAFIWYSLPK